MPDTDRRNDTDLALARAWQCIADACIEHDREHEQRALADLAALIPPQRQP